MGSPISERAAFLVHCEPVCDHCGHGQSLHADDADIECVACVERDAAGDCPSFTSFGSMWRAPLSGRSAAADAPRLAAGWR